MAETKRQNIKPKNRRWINVPIALALGLLCFIASYADTLYSLDSLYKDRVYQIPRGMNPNIKIISIDEKTLSELGTYGTWPRSTYKRLLENLGDYPQTVAFDIMFLSETETEDDKELSDYLATRDDVVMASHIIFDKKVEYDENGDMYINEMHFAEIEEPYMGDNVKSGFANVYSDSDGIVRRVNPVIYSDDGTAYNSFAYSIYLMSCKQQGITPVTPEVDRYGNQWLHYAGRPFEYETISFCDVLDGKVDPRIFTNCVVLVGAYATGLQDQFSVPGSGDQMFGVEINANIVQSYMEGVFPLPADRLAVSISFALIVVLFYMLISNVKMKWSTVAFIVCEVGIIVAGILLFTKGQIIIPSVYLILSFAVAYAICIVLKYSNEYLAKRKVVNAFSKYVEPKVVEEIVKKGNFDVRLGGENRDVAVLFVDIRGFTPLSESLNPEQVVEILNLYLNLTSNSILGNHGMVDKFIGDATMAIFNAPFDLEDYEYHAVCAAWDIVAGAKALEEECVRRFGKSVSFGVGVNCGEAVVGNIGSEKRLDYTAIGDTVNTAARLESNAKRGQVLISEKLYKRLEGRIEVNEIGVIPLKGKSEGICVYELTGIPGKDVGEKA